MDEVDTGVDVTAEMEVMTTSEPAVEVTVGIPSMEALSVFSAERLDSTDVNSSCN